MSKSNRVVIFVDEANVTCDVWYLMDAVARGERKLQWKTRDPIVLFKDRLIAQEMWDEERDQALRQELFDEVSKAQKAAEAAPDPAPEQALEHVFYEGTGAQG